MLAWKWSNANVANGYQICCFTVHVDPPDFHHPSSSQLLKNNEVVK